jgi:hypothetical protein
VGVKRVEGTRRWGERALFGEMWLFNFTASQPCFGTPSPSPYLFVQQTTPYDLLIIHDTWMHEDGGSRGAHSVADMEVGELAHKRPERKVPTSNPATIGAHSIHSLAHGSTAHTR